MVHLNYFLFSTLALLAKNFFAILAFPKAANYNQRCFQYESISGYSYSYKALNLRISGFFKNPGIFS